MAGARRRKRVNIRDVAERAGVSITTVSHALNGKGRVDPTTRQRVVDAARGLGYHPNQNARNLLMQRSGMLAMTLSSHDRAPVGLFDLEFFVRFINAATSAALALGYALVLAPPGGAEAFDGVDIDGAIVVDPSPRDPLLLALRERNIPVVTSGRALELPEIAWVDNDLAGGMRTLMDHLSRATKRIALLTYSPDYSFTVDTRRAYDEWCASVGMPTLVVEAEGGLTEAAGSAAALKLFAVPDRPGAVCAVVDRHAVGAAEAAKSLGLSIPADIQIACVTDSEAARSSQPAITALDLQPETNGRRAVESLIRLIDGEDARADLVPTRLLARGSTAHGRAADRAAAAPVGA